MVDWFVGGLVALLGVVGELQWGRGVVNCLFHKTVCSPVN